MHESDLDQAKRVLDLEAQCILAARDKLDARFTNAVEMIFNTVKQGGKVVVSGVGKSGKIAMKVAATLASTGTPALFLHPTEAVHGDLGMVRQSDIMLVISYSGASEEVLGLLPSFRNRDIKIISIVGNMNSPLAQHSEIALDGGVAQEACAFGLAPTSSTTVALSLGDALAIVLSTRLDFKEEQFAVNHPGGTLGRRLTLKVQDLMKTGAELPWATPTDGMDTIVEISTEKRLGVVLVESRPGELLGLITDGDIRRALRHKEKFFKLHASDIMTAAPVSIKPDEKAIRALELMENRPMQISLLPVIDAQGKCVGVLRLHDIIGRL